MRVENPEKLKRLELYYKKLLLVTKEVIEKGIKEVEDIEIKLQTDPSDDMSQLQENIAIVQGYLSITSRLLNEIKRLGLKFDILKTEAGWLIDDKREEIILQKEIRDTRPKAAQEAKIAGLLSPEINFCRRLQLQEKKMNTYIKVLEETEHYVSRSNRSLAMQVGVLKGQVWIGEHRIGGNEGPRRF